MKTTKIETKFDCLAFKQYSQEKISQDLEEMSHSEQIEYLKRKINESAFKTWWESIKANTTA